MDGLAAGIGEDAKVGRRDRPAHRLSQFGFELVGSPKPEGLVELALYRCNNWLRRVPEEERAEPEDIINILVAVDVEKTSALPVGETNRDGTLGSTEPGRHPSSQMTLGPPELLGRPAKTIGHFFLRSWAWVKRWPP